MVLIGILLSSINFFVPSSIFPLLIMPITPLPGIAVNSDTFKSFIFLFFASFKTAFAKGCSEFFSIEAASFKISSSLALLFVVLRIWVNLGSPFVRVPVLSNITVLMVCAISKALEVLISIPFRAESPVPTITAVGVAKPRAQGQAMIKTATKALSANTELALKIIHIIRVIKAMPKTLGTK